jgi:hypothetical protein
LWTAHPEIASVTFAIVQQSPAKMRRAARRPVRIGEDLCGLDSQREDERGCRIVRRSLASGRARQHASMMIAASASPYTAGPSPDRERGRAIDSSALSPSRLRARIENRQRKQTIDER